MLRLSRRLKKIVFCFCPVRNNIPFIIIIINIINEFKLAFFKLLCLIASLYQLNLHFFLVSEFCSECKPKNYDYLILFLRASLHCDLYKSFVLPASHLIMAYIAYLTPNFVFFKKSASLRRFRYRYGNSCWNIPSFRVRWLLEESHQNL